MTKTVSLRKVATYQYAIGSWRIGHSLVTGRLNAIVHLGFVSVTTAISLVTPDDKDLGFREVRGRYRVENL